MQPAAIEQRRLQDAANKSQDVQEAKQLQEVANNSPQVQQAMQMQEAANNSPQVQEAKQFQLAANNSPYVQNAKKGLPFQLQTNPKAKDKHYDSNKENTWMAAGGLFSATGAEAGDAVDQFKDWVNSQMK